MHPVLKKSILHEMGGKDGDLKRMEKKKKQTRFLQTFHYNSCDCGSSEEMSYAPGFRKVSLHEMERKGRS